MDGACVVIPTVLVKHLKARISARFDIYHAYIAQGALMHILTETTPTSLSAADLLVLKTIYPAFKITILDACMEAIDTRHIATQTQTHALLKAVNMFI